MNNGVNNVNHAPIGQVFIQEDNNLQQVPQQAVLFNQHLIQPVNNEGQHHQIQASAISLHAQHAQAIGNPPNLSTLYNNIATNAQYAADYLNQHGWNAEHVNIGAFSQFVIEINNLISHNQALLTPEQSTQIITDRDEMHDVNNQEQPIQRIHQALGHSQAAALYIAQQVLLQPPLAQVIVAANQGDDNNVANMQANIVADLVEGDQNPLPVVQGVPLEESSLSSASNPHYDDALPLSSSSSSGTDSSSFLSEHIDYQIASDDEDDAAAMNPNNVEHHNEDGAGFPGDPNNIFPPQ